MKLTTLERAMLINQLEIRKALTKSADFDERIEILERGYEVFYEEAVGHMHEPMPVEAARVVFDVLDMYRAIEIFHDANPGDKEVAELYAPHFRGFDGNNEGEYLGFTRFLIKKQRKYEEQLKYERETDSFNSHWPMVPTYLAAVDRWKELSTDERWALTREQVARILTTKKHQRAVTGE